jgi:hypothetical protein
MTIDQIIALVSSIVACLGAVVNFCTLREMKKQRAAAYQPELVVSEKTFQGTASSEVNRVPTSWVELKHGGRIIEESDMSEIFFRVPLCNLGLGAAKEIRATWSFPTNELAELINKKAQQTLTPLHVTFEKEVLHIKSDNLINEAVIMKNDSSEAIDYVLPVSVQPDPLNLKLPISYIDLTSLLIYLICKEGNDRRHFSEIPDIKLQLEYRDIANARYKSTLSLKFQLVAIVGNGESFIAYLEPSRT